MFATSAVNEVPRVMTQAEAEVLDAPLAFDFPGVDGLRIQASALLVKRSCTCGCGSLYLYPQGRNVPVSCPRVVEINGDVFDDSDNAVGGVQLFVHDGLLSELEVYSYGAPLAMPSTDMIEWHRTTGPSHRPAERSANAKPRSAGDPPQRIRRRDVRGCVALTMASGSARGSRIAVYRIGYVGAIPQPARFEPAWAIRVALAGHGRPYSR
ncbi:hypothetical protein [Mycobacterium sp. NPDC050853]|uniref:hypothetical protein n=1 Tax=Mycobacterium sp. NPDC050853 TaxID=3155160 RepID=UPI003407184F